MRGRGRGRVAPTLTLTLLLTLNLTLTLTLPLPLTLTSAVAAGSDAIPPSWDLADVRGLCAGRSTDTDGRAVEVVVWLDGCRLLRWHALWEW